MSAVAAQSVWFEFSNGLRLRYRLNDSATARDWSAMLARMEPGWMAHNAFNHRHGFATEAEIHAGADRLQACARFLGIPIEPLTSHNWHTVLNRAHSHFPDFFLAPTNLERFQVAHQMNLLIHWLEYELLNALEGKKQFLFTLDFNHHPPAYQLKQAFAEDALAQFSPLPAFGNLHLHYLYIGRHFLEMFDAQDQVAPAAQFKAQHEFNATCSLSFSEPGDAAQPLQAMQQYHQSRGGRAFFGYDFDDPRLAKGFFAVAQLDDLQAYASLERRNALRAQLKEAQVVGWTFDL